MAEHRNIHWVAPTLMLGSLLTGILFAIGHHCFYQNLNGTVASESFILGSISYQQANIAIGTALVFIVKSFLVLAVATAFIQVFWKASSEHSRTSAHTVRQLDVLYSGLNNAFALAHIRIWSKCLTLLGLSAIAWLIPIASIITPATLSIQSAPLDIITATEVPNLDFGSFDFLAEMPTWAYPNHYSYAGPHTDVLTVTNSVLSGGSILAMEPPGANSSWVVEFLGPSLKCEKVNETMEDRLLGNYIDAHFLRQADGGPLCYSPSYGYYAWSPRFNFSGPSDLPFLGGRNASLLSLNFAGGTLADSQVLDAVAAPALYIMTFPGYSNQWGWDGCQWNNTQPSRHYEGTILQCHLYNSTYRTAFNYTDGNQSITVEISKREDEPQSSIIWGMSTPFHYHGQPFVWCPDRDTWNESSGRWTHAKHPLYTGTKFHAPDCELCGSFNRKLLQGLSYQAVFDAFSSTLKGVAPNIPGDNSYPAWRSYPRSKVMETQLVQNKDLNFLRTSRSTRVADENLQQYVSTLNDTNVMGVLKQKSEISDRPLGEEIERMFKDVTVSLMSSKHLRLNYSSNFAPPPPNVTHHKYHNVYTYSAWKLWTAYAIAILFAAIAVLIGLETMLSVGVSYSDDFSTIFRIARGAEVSRPILDKDLDGKDPLPDYMGASEVYFSLGQGQAGSYQAVKNIQEPMK